MAHTSAIVIKATTMYHGSADGPSQRRNYKGHITTYHGSADGPCQRHNYKGHNYIPQQCRWPTRASIISALLFPIPPRTPHTATSIPLRGAPPAGRRRVRWGRRRAESGRSKAHESGRRATARRCAAEPAWVFFFSPAFFFILLCTDRCDPPSLGRCWSRDRPIAGCTVRRRAPPRHPTRVCAVACLRSCLAHMSAAR